MALKEVDKSNILIDVEEKDNGQTYKFKYNENISFNYKKFKNRVLVNKATKESYKYMDVLIMRDKNNKDMYIFHRDFENIFSPNITYSINEWTFEDDIILQTNNLQVQVKDAIVKYEDLFNVVTDIHHLLKTVVNHIADSGMGLKKELEPILERTEKIVQGQRSTTPVIQQQEPVQKLSSTWTMPTSGSQSQAQHTVYQGQQDGISFKRAW